MSKKKSTTPKRPRKRPTSVAARLKSIEQIYAKIWNTKLQIADVTQVKKELNAKLALLETTHHRIVHDKTPPFWDPETGQLVEEVAGGDATAGAVTGEPEVGAAA